MLRAVTLVGAWRRIESELPGDWAEARLRLTLADETQGARAVSLLGPAMPGRSGAEIRFHCARGGVGIGPEAVVRLLERLDGEAIGGRLELLASAEAASSPPAAAGSLQNSWEAALAALPPDWSDIYGEVELGSTDYLDRAALLLSPLNPARFDETAGFRFRCARSSGYGVSPAMAGRSLGRLDEAQIRGEVRVLLALSDTHHVGSQGPVFRLGHKAV